MTAEEFIQENHFHLILDCKYEVNNIQTAMIEFAKLHVKQALQEASEKADIINDFDNQKGEIDIESILNAYSLENIK